MSAGGGRLALVVGGSREVKRRRCPKCGAEMRRIGQRVFGTQAFMEYGEVSGLFHVYVCGRCPAVHLISYDHYVYRNLVEKVKARAARELLQWELIQRPTPASFLKLCMSCGSRIPIASEECQFCGSKQPYWKETERKMRRAGRASRQSLAEFEEKRTSTLVGENALVSTEAAPAHGSEATPRAGVGVKQGECVVCRSPVGKRDDVFTCPHCGNVAHMAHMLEWLHVKGTCPVCNQHIAHY